jgi:hypothetical protein
MPFTDEDGDRLEKGERQVTTRTVSVTDSATVTMSELTNISNILGSKTEGSTVDTANDAVAEVVQGSADNEVDVTLFTGGGTDTLDTTTNQTGQTRIVTIVVEGF